MVPERDTADWPKQIADRVEHYVRLVHDKITVKVVKAIRGVVFGVLGGIVGLSALVLLVIMLVRVLTIALFGRVWIAYLLIGVVFLVAGSFCMRKRHPRTTES